MISSKSLSELLPSVRSMMIHFIAVAEMRLSEELGKKVSIVPTMTYRDYEYQDMLYAKGRTTEGPKVTNARGGESWHNFRCAMDVAVELDGKITWNPQYYQMLGVVAKECGLQWGGDWNGDGVHQPEDFDLVHFQFTGGRTLAELRTLHEQGKELA